MSYIELPCLSQSTSTNRGYAFVEFTTEDGARRAVMLLNCQRVRVHPVTSKQNVEPQGDGVEGVDGEEMTAERALATLHALNLWLLPKYNAPLL